MLDACKHCGFFDFFPMALEAGAVKLQCLSCGELTLHALTAGPDPYAGSNGHRRRNGNGTAATAPVARTAAVARPARTAGRAGKPSKAPKATAASRKDAKRKAR
jgi:hypothetical protein